MPESVEVTRLMQAIEQYEARAPKDAPPELTKALQGVKGALGGQQPEEGTPGQRAAASATYGTGVPLKHAAKGDDSLPTPGQKAARGIPDEIREAAQRIVRENT